ncbi:MULTISPECIES: ABC transporter substrate-binding protein [unclassified Actinomyces]|uniref:ABC transporter substrate-binding protein n=1 Tax=unclassified Actinomyces TaxID=2609248 RepID=UPI000D59D979|nr:MULTISPECIES: ABC transporter substrate-binding protein [unclassified Actinomyces]RAX21081.1 ABC transporter substrate-binding protein [Actinomyces sp. Z3]RAX21528.1 ABC transporter substrate-binding protein [Actinomyces sp. Z5]
MSSTRPTTTQPASTRHPETRPAGRGRFAVSRRGLLAGAGVSGLALALAACGANSRSTATATAATASAGGTLYVLSTDTDINWDPAKSQSLAITSLGLVHRRLTTWDITADGVPAVVPDLATDTGTISEDGLTWTYTLKEGITLEDGTPITSAHIKYGLERSFASALSGGLGYHKTLLADAEGYTGPYDGEHLDSIETPDERTIIFHLDHPYGDWPWIVSLPAFAPVPEDSDDPATYAQAPVASGPYRVESYQQGNSVTLARNENWSAATDEVRTALPEQIVFSLGQDEDTVSQRLIADSGDDQNAFSAQLLTASKLAQVSADPNASARLATSDPGPLLYLAINTERITDPDVRKAIAYAVDKTAVQRALGGELGAGIATTYITPGIPGQEDYDLYPTDLEQAKSLLEGKDVPELVLLSQNNEARLAISEAVQQSLTELGLKVTIDPQSSDAYTERATQGDGSTYDLTVVSWNPDYPSANANIQPLYASSEIGQGGYNISRYSDPEVDQLITEASQESDPEAAATKWAALDRRIAEDVPAVPLVNRRNSFLPGSKVTGFFVAPFPAYPNYLVLGVSE